MSADIDRLMPVKFRDENSGQPANKRRFLVNCKSSFEHPGTGQSDRVALSPPANEEGTINKKGASSLPETPHIDV